MTNNSTVAPVGGMLMVPRHIQIGVTILAGILIILAMIGNTLVIYIVFTVNHMRSSTNTLIANMAFANLLMTIDIPYVLKWLYVWDKWFGTFMGSLLCKFFHSAQVGSIAASVFGLVAISLDRSFAILFPMRTIMTRKVVRFAISMIWLCTLALTVPLMIAVKNTQQKGTEFHICRENWPPMSKTTYHTIFITTAYIIPLTIIAVVYFLAGFRLWRRKVPGHNNPIAHKKAQASSRRATAMLITVVIIFALSWLPLQVAEMLKVFNRRLFVQIPIEVLFVIPWLGLCNSAINPILYVIFSENYRNEFYRILCRGPSRVDRNRVAVVGRCPKRQPGKFVATPTIM
ncbi:Somatostatin receptor type 5 [Desmophyllum pertusum]|uniref:Somatostatin receptor type 5 n=1 Tax=Desmophyllum pertusum TaxID=174260 RepID=A0A9X0CH41_9CNID|nr:Somatostatin receptor type 5 [Desmophyllum pertusum]